MALLIGTKPVVWNDSLTGLSQRIYDQNVSDGLYLGSSQFTQVVNGDTYTETESDRNSRVLSNKLEAYSIAKSIIDEITTNADVSTTVAAGIGVQVNTGTGTGATTSTGTGSGGVT